VCTVWSRRSFIVCAPWSSVPVHKGITQMGRYVSGSLVAFPPSQTELQVFMKDAVICSCNECSDE
jgi:hypothetical protein